jgi:hypothetical protein
MLAIRSNLVGLNFYLLFGIFSTLYSYSWDIVMDWGLLRGSGGSKGMINKLLRDRLKYPASFYLFSAFTNFFLRFAWILPIVDQMYWHSLLGETLMQMEVLFFFLALAELYRRAQWSLFRVENENINNYEKYRTIHEIPKVIDE